MNFERFLGMGAVLFAIPIAIISWGFGIGSFKSPGAGFWPLGIAVIMFGLGLFLTLHPQPKEITESGSPHWGKFIIALGTLVFYVIFLEPLGYLITTTAMLFVQLRWVEECSWKSSTCVATSAAIISLILFRILLKVSLPDGVIPLPAEW